MTIWPNLLNLILRGIVFWRLCVYYVYLLPSAEATFLLVVVVFNYVLFFV